ncbi:MULTISPECIES: DUF2920 family protein [Sporosarcina]|uniref:DUF2920 family protein n=1 Tax=Sporosarcina newyorkensis TaxID=759851 RepID=A0A1T4Y1Q7_9BACL|nr:MULTISPECIES: DUF2920 family protein [Sporosarcina]MBY0223486.1 DUF2920 family protein [Sporosarcina aquimarina]SKA95706.1 Protein of unknown function [Sporosarcina newyorkensis]
MAGNQSITIPAHPNIYNGSTGRDLRIDFSIPNSGMSDETGILILVPGFGAHIESKVYKKMRDVFADKYNLVTVQCSFFGDEFMQGADNFNLKNGMVEVERHLNVDGLEALQRNPSDLLNLLSTKSLRLPVMAKLVETNDNFNDMGFMQAIDIVTALETIKTILKENGLPFNERKVIGYGHSHGAHLLHLSNRLAPHLFSYIVDNSAWIEPVYLSANRCLYQQYGSMLLQIEFDYLAKEVVTDKKALSLNTLYDNFNNHAKMIVFQGTNDSLIDYRLKEKVVSKIENSIFVLVDVKDIDNQIFKSNMHGLDADFLNMFEWALEKMGDYENEQTMKRIDEIQLSNTKITVNYNHGLPVFVLEL